MICKSDHYLTRLSRIAAPCLMIFLAITLFAQDQVQAQAQDQAKDKKEKPSPSDYDQPLAVDSARKAAFCRNLKTQEELRAELGGF